MGNNKAKIYENIKNDSESTPLIQVSKKPVKFLKRTKWRV